MPKPAATPATQPEIPTGVTQTHLTFRCPTPMGVGLRREALVRGVDVAVLLRQAVDEWAEAHGVNLKTL